MTQHAPILLAHAFGARYDLPIPLALFVVGGAAVVVVSFLLVLPRNVAPATGDQPALHDRAPLTALRQPWTGISLIGLLLLTGCGLLGSDVVSENIVRPRSGCWCGSRSRCRVGCSGTGPVG